MLPYCKMLTVNFYHAKEHSHKIDKIDTIKAARIYTRSLRSLSGDFLRLLLRIWANDKTLASKAVARPRKKVSVTWQQTDVTA